MRDYGDKIIFIGLPGEDSTANMSEFVKKFSLQTMIHAVDIDTSLRRQFGTRFRGTWIYINQDGTVTRTIGHVPPSEFRKNMERLIAG